MVTLQEQLLSVLEDLGKEDLKGFQWFLQNAEIMSPFPAIPKSKLETADRMDTVDLMVQTYGKDPVEVTKKVLSKMNKNDLVQRLSGTSSGAEDSNSSLCEGERRDDLPSAAIRKPLGQSAGGLHLDMSLLSIRKDFISGVSGPTLKRLLDGLFEKRVINDSEREEAHGMQNRADKASFVIDMVRKKGERASSQMIALLCEEDPFLSENLGLMRKHN
ncbi:uncharacterized protein LOC115379033 [Myripristis murdjan]|uniref:uncharacterized protein LOC115379033 n=1 Tax=Myripristis murdjan TaxID=586833 RepID=UPI001175F867|nr:uncharacterized protein LOC115379033 [Myripristis murdjan]